MRVYIAAPYTDAVFVRETVFPMLQSLDLEPVASWAVEADGKVEDLITLGMTEARRRWSRNRNDLQSCDVILVIARDGLGGEMFAEIECARFLGMHIYWCGRPTLSTFSGPQIRFRAETKEKALTSATEEIQRLAVALGRNLIAMRRPKPPEPPR